MSDPPARALVSRAVPVIFVVLWASGFVVARLVRVYAEPETFVTVRFACSGLVLAAIAWMSGAKWPRTAAGWRASMLAGALMQGGYVGGVFWAVKHGLPAAVAALISGLQPLLTGALAGPLLGEIVTPCRWLGILIGFGGAILVLLPNLEGARSVEPAAVAVCFGAMLAITLGTIVQKRIGDRLDLRSGAAIQFLGGLVVTLPLAAATEHFRIANVPAVWIGLAWGVGILSVSATLLLLRLLKDGAVARVSSLFYLVPPVTAVMALMLFGETLAMVQLIGMAVAALGVAVANLGWPPRSIPLRFLWRDRSVRR